MTEDADLPAGGEDDRAKAYAEYQRQKAYEAYLAQKGGAPDTPAPPTARTLPGGLVTRAPANPNPIAPVTTGPATEGQQIVGGIGNAWHAVTHPVETVKGMVTGPIRDLGDALAPQEGEPYTGDTVRYGMPALGTLRLIRDMIQGRVGAKPGEMITRENTPSALTPTQAAGPAARTVVAATIPAAAALGIPPWLIAPVAGALSDPDQPLRGATGASVLGMLGKVAGKAEQTARHTTAGTAITDWAARKADAGLAKLPQSAPVTTARGFAQAASPMGRAASEIADRAKIGGKDVATEAQAVATPPLADMAVMPGDRLGPAVHDLQGHIYRSGLPEGIQLKTALEDRAKGAVPATDAELARTFGVPANQPNGVPQHEALSAIEAERQDLGRQFREWHDANRGDVNNPRVDQIMQYPVMQELVKRVAAVREGHPDLPPLPRRGSGLLPGMSPEQSATALAAMEKRGIQVPQEAIGSPQMVPDIEALHDMKKALSHATRDVFGREGGTPISKMQAAAAAPLVDELRSIIAPEGTPADALFKAFQNNRQRYEALTETGPELLKTAKDGVALTEAERTVGAQPPDVKAMTRLGASGAVRDRLLTKEPPASGLMDQHAAKAFPESANQERALATVLTPDELAAAKVQADQRGQAFLNRSNTLTGSPTDRFGKIDKVAGGISPQTFLRDVTRANKGFLGADITAALLKRKARPFREGDYGAAVDLLTPSTAPASADALSTINRLAGRRTQAANLPNTPAMVALKALLAQTANQRQP